jgi:hypothetical protein
LTGSAFRIREHVDEAYYAALARPILTYASGFLAQEELPWDDLLGSPEMFAVSPAKFQKMAEAAAFSA